MNAQTLVLELSRTMDKRQLVELSGSLYDAASKTYDHLAAAPEQYRRNEPARIAAYRATWQELRDLAEYAGRIAETMPSPASPMFQCDRCGASFNDGIDAGNHTCGASPMFEIIGRMIHDEAR